MNARTILILSLGLNLILGGWFVSQWKRHRPPPANSTPAAETAMDSTRSPRLQQTSVVEVITNIVEGPGFRWAQIETNDFYVYVANLRAIGCPERTVQHLLIAELGEFFRERMDDESPHPYWETASQRGQRQREQDRRKIVLREEWRGLLRELAGVTYSPSAFETWRKEKEAAAILGFLSDTKSMEVIDLIESTEQKATAVRSEAGKILIEEDQQKIEALVAETSRAFASNLSPAELEELNLRLLAMIQNRQTIPNETLLGTDITGAELRTLTQLAASGVNGMETLVRLIVASGDLDEALPHPPENFESEARKLLGDRRYAAYVRSSDENFRAAYDITKRQNLSPAAAETVYDARRAAEQELQRLVSDDSINGETRRAAIGEIRTVTEQAIRQALGEEGAKQYLEKRPIHVPGQKSTRQP